MFFSSTDEDHVLALAEKDSANELAEYLKTIGMEEFVEAVLKNDVTGDMAIEVDGEVMAEHGMSAVTFLRFRVLYRRHLLQRKSELAKRCPVETVVKFFEQFSILENHVNVIIENGLDGEMLLEASKRVFDELKITATGRRKIEKKLKEFAFTYLYSLVESKMQTQQLEELNESMLTENVHTVVLSEVPVAQNQAAEHIAEQTSKQLKICLFVM